MSDGGPQLIEAPSRPVVIDLPPGWAQVEAQGPIVLMARMPRDEGPVIPTITVTHTVEPKVKTARAYLESQVAGTYQMFGGHLVHLELIGRPEQHLDLALSFEHLGMDVTVVQRHLIRPEGEAVIATGIAPDRHWFDYAPLLVPAVRSLRSAS